jgi:hypothetical protein
MNEKIHAVDATEGTDIEIETEEDFSTLLDVELSAVAGGEGIIMF